MVNERRAEPSRTMDDPRWEPGMPVLDRQADVERAAVGTAPSARGPSIPLDRTGPAAATPRSVPETRPTPLQRQYVILSAVVLVCGFVAITALEMGAPLGSPLVKLCVLVGAPILVVTTLDAIVRIWRSAWAWMPVDRGRGAFRLCWVAAALVGVAALGAGSIAVLVA